MSSLAQTDMRRNRLIAALPDASWWLWKPLLEPIRMQLGDVLYEPGDEVRHLYFPITSTVSLLNILANGASVQIGIVGSEGVAGVAALMGGGATRTRAVVQSAGVGGRLAAQVVRDEFERGGAVMALLLRYTQALMAQMSQIAICNRYHTPEQQLCRWILLSIDRASSEELITTHELIAAMLGIRRETVTDAAQKLQGRGLIRHRRGRIQVIDRPGLEQRACECYATIKQEYERLLPASADGRRAP